VAIFTLVCRPCGNSVTVDGPPIQIGIDLLSAADAVGWTGVFGGGRCAVFCSQECVDAALTKQGTLRRDLGRGKRKVEEEKQNGNHV
jgi:hypothetical protein